MASMIHITRDPQQDEDRPGISLGAWIAVVEQHAHTRLAEGHYSVTLPETGQVFTLHNTGGDTEVNFAGTGWRRVFRWDEDELRVTFRATEDFADAACHLRVVARDLAKALDAVLCGDDGEVCS